MLCTSRWRIMAPRARSSSEASGRQSFGTFFFFFLSFLHGSANDTRSFGITTGLAFFLVGLFLGRANGIEQSFGSKVRCG